MSLYDPSQPICIPFEGIREGLKRMSTSPCALKSPPPRVPPEGRAQTRSSGPAASPCVVCSPPVRESVRSPLNGGVDATEDPVALMVEAWCSPTLVSPAGRQISVMQLQQHQATGPIDIHNAFVEDEQWDMEAPGRISVVSW